ncbi:MAG: hypothetical protein H0X43_13290 [Nitrosospira sp.]|nr:hypothetical protein [Nitrosospira sp.]
MAKRLDCLNETRQAKAMAIKESDAHLGAHPALDALQMIRLHLATNVSRIFWQQDPELSPGKSHHSYRKNTLPDTKWG